MMKNIGVAIIAASFIVVSDAACSVAQKMTCKFTSTAPTLDGNFSDWSSVEGIETDIYDISGTKYADGAVMYKCVYDASNIYFALMIPGPYRFNATNNQMCPSIATMFKVGTMATFYNMGGCPDAISPDSCSGGIPEQCDEYRVDIGAHWETSTSEQGLLYAVNSTTGTGEGAVTELGDEYAVSPYCRASDDGEGAGNEWAGAWAHTDPSETGADGHYHFELSRLLKTKSSKTDKQVLTAGETYSFGIAYWDPFQSDENGWTDAGHFLTGCANQWIDLELESVTTTDGSDSGGKASSSEWLNVGTFMYVMTVAAVVVAL
ncbi:Ethylbenzene dehydrogenase [Fragilaria crotonensis]|nr:Ethylbenzene dehydrogenase [Fragilaria crotonensis]